MDDLLRVAGKVTHTQIELGNANFEGHEKTTKREPASRHDWRNGQTPQKCHRDQGCLWMTGIMSSQCIRRPPA